VAHDLPRVEGVDVFWTMFDSSPEMVAAAQAAHPRASVWQWDLRDGFPPSVARWDSRLDLQLFTLTLQFVPVELRLGILTAARVAARADGGAIVLVEKTLPTPDNAWMLTRHKRRAGYTEEQIAAKERSLQNVLVPLRAEWTEQLLRDAGWRNVQTFWARQAFRGWVAWR
jgi:hypothetical protein